MRKVVVELDEREMAHVEALARERQVQPAEVLKSAALKIAQSPPQPDTDEAKEQRRQARFAILMRSHGMLAGDQSRPKDGLVYQNELRAEWQ
ncbi:hypothetical protein GTP55_22595 [Duganella sp. FT109W]|uniref:Uncharacterized protein n=1 Tax=Duganella margarita TaxID=2692170 RepID=A0A7X4H6E1_9BURK|nr:hypothetical protein [Duganella margarita]MYM75560.1 hypothetical protein [Duganella margarita]MYN42148.1 hypothetical protein [Duganella margarita]